MDKYPALDARRLGEFLVAQAAPRLRERLAALEALRRERHRLNAPVAAHLVRVYDIHRLVRRDGGHRLVRLELEEVALQKHKWSSQHCGCAGGSTHLPREELLEEDDLPAGVDACLARFDGRDEQVARREPRLRVVVELAEELRARERGRLLELCLWEG